MNELVTELVIFFGVYILAVVLFMLPYINRNRKKNR